MYIVAGAVILIYAGLYLAGNRIKYEGARNGIMGAFDRMSHVIHALYIKVFRRKNSKYTERASPSTVQCLEMLFPGEDLGEVKDRYVIQKVSMSLIIFLIGTVMCAAVKYTGDQEKQKYMNGEIDRGDYLEGSRLVNLTANIDGSEENYEIEIMPRKLSAEEIERALGEFLPKLESLLCGKNDSIDEVFLDVNLIERIDGFPFKVEWTSSDVSKIAMGSGRVKAVKEPEKVILTAKISYEDFRCEEEFVITIVPKPLSEEEANWESLGEMLVNSEKDSREKSTWILPEEYRGKSITWSGGNKDISVYILIAAIVVAVVVFFMMDKDLSGKVDERKKEMKRDYPDIVQKLALYIGAGMTTRAAFEKIAKDGDGQKSIYSEMLFAVRELQGGISEGNCYERFGRRTGLQEYIRLTTLLGQNLKKGSSNLIERLREEAEVSCKEKLLASRKIGEEASTKLLIPMVLMLVVVMIIIMLPAFSSMGI